MSAELFDGTWQILRYLTALISVVSAALWIATCLDLHNELDIRLQRAWPWVAVLLLVLAYAAGEAAHGGLAGGLRLVFLPASLAGLGMSLALGFKPKHPKH